MKKINCKNFIDEATKYAKRKTVVMAISLSLSALGVLVACLLTSLEGFNIIDTKIAWVFWLVYVLFLVIAIIALNYFEKKRGKLISIVNEDMLKVFFEYFKGIKEPNYIYYEIKDIFMYGLWNLSESNEYLKILMFTDLTEEHEAEIIDNVYKKSFMAASLFRCLTFKQDGITFRNQEIYLKQGVFLKIVDEYEKIYSDKQCIKKDFVQKCKAIEQKYKDYKISAQKNYKGIPEKTSFMNRCYILINKPNFVLGLNVVLFVTAIIFAGLQAMAHFFTVEKIDVDIGNIDYIVTVIFEAITIILLWVDIVSQNKKRGIH